MAFINIEIKAKCIHPEKVDAFLLAHGARFVGEDRQTDTYFHVREGRLKLREGNIENNLIFYRRNDGAADLKQSDFSLSPVHDAALKSVLAAALGIKVVVHKQRRIYFIGNVKFHVDAVDGLGTFVEIEAGNKEDPSLTVERLEQQCRQYMQELGIEEKDLVHCSYSDLLMSALT